MNDYLRALQISPRKNISISSIEKLKNTKLADFEFVAFMFGKGCLVDSKKWLQAE